MSNNNPLFNYDVEIDPMTIDIRSDTLEPISTSKNRVVFRLDATGNLDQNSVLLFKPQMNTAAAGLPTGNVLRANCMFGGLGAIKRATIQVGDYILNDSSDIGRIASLMSLASLNPATRNQVGGHYYQNSSHTEVLSVFNVAKTTNGGTGSIAHDNGRSGVDFGRMDDNNAWTTVNSCVITANKDNNSQIGIPLGTILPCLKNRSLPLYLFQEYRILITIEFHDSSEWVNNIMNKRDHAGGNSLKGMVCGVDEVTYEDVKLQVDYIIMPSEIQAKNREAINAEGGLRLDFFDIVKVEKNIPAGTPNEEQKVEFRIGADNKEVHKIYMMKRLQRGATTSKRQAERLFIGMRSNGMNQESYNVNIDGADIYPDDKWSPASQYDEVSNCLGSDLSFCRPTYFCDENTIASRLAAPRDGILGQYKPLCLDLTNGEPVIVGGGRSIGSYPIIWKYMRKPLGNFFNPVTTANGGNDDSAQGDLTSQLWYDCSLECQVDFFMLVSRVANIRSTAQGTSISVSY